MTETSAQDHVQLPEPPSAEVMDHAIAGAVYEAQGEYMLALHEYNRGLLKDSTRTELYHAAAEMYTQLGEYDSAVLLLEDGSGITGDASLYTHLGELQMQMQEYDDAIATFGTLSAIEPDNPTAQQHLASALERVGRIPEALEVFDSLLEYEGVDREPILMHKVTLLSSLERYPEAVEVYQELQEFRPDEDRIPFFMGGLFLDMGDTTRAVESISAAAMMRPVEPRYWDLWIRLEMVRGNEQRASSLCDSAMSYNPISASIHALAASIFMLQDAQDKAEFALRRAIDIEPTNSEHYLNLGFLYHDLERWLEAENLYQDALKLSPGDPQVLNNFAYLLAEQGKDLERALELSEDAISMEPENPSFLDTKGWIHFHLKDYEQARIFLERASEIDPDHYEILSHLGDLYSAMGLRELARESWQKSLNAGGDEIELTRKLEE
jgi:tetratricopeptide (TPR) repeat protein